jgi:hypothetical protein
MLLKNIKNEVNMKSLDKYFNKTMLIAASGLLLLASCKKDEAKLYYTGGTAPVLTATVTGSIPLPITDTTATAVTFTWTNPNYQFSNGISSMNVTYYLQFDTTAAFNSPNMQTVAVSADLSKTFTVASLNNLIGNGLQLAFGQPHTLLVRLESFLQPFTSATPVAAPLVSTALSYAVTPFAPPPVVTPPSTGTLFIVGSATPGGSAHGWDNPISNTPVSQQQFTEISPTEYKITIPLIGGGEYKLIAVNGSWTNQWSVAKADTYPTGGPFVFNGANSIAPAASGTYTIDVNFQTGIFTVTQ